MLPCRGLYSKGDRAQFDSDWAGVRVIEVTPSMALRYLLSGGVSMRSLQPGWSYGAWKKLETILGIEQRMAIFAVTVIERVDVEAGIQSRASRVGTISSDCSFI
jgi:hypothetical protein